MQLEIVLLDAQAAAGTETVGHHLGVEAFAQESPVQVRRPISNGRVPALAQMRCHDPLETGPAGVQVAHGGSLDAGRPCVGRAHGHGQVHRHAGLLRVETHQPRRSCRRPDSSPGAVGVHLSLDRGRRADAGDDLVPDDYAGQNLAAVAPQVLADGHGPGRHVDGRVPAAQAITLVHFQRHAGGGVHHGRPYGLDPALMPKDGRRARPAHRRGKSGKVGVFTQSAAGEDRADGVQHYIFCSGDGGGIKVLPSRFDDKLGQPVEVILGHGHTYRVKNSWSRRYASSGSSSAM